MSDQTTPRASHAARSGTVGKLIVVLLFGGAFGYSYHGDVIARNLRAATLPAERAADCPFSPATLVQQPLPLWGDMTVVVVMLILFFGLYELLGWGVGRLVGWAAAHRA